MKRYRLIQVDTTESTNTYAKQMPAPADIDDMTPSVVITDNQTEGRGQRGNTWQSEPGKNLTFSLVVYPVWLAAAHQFELSMLVSIGLVNALRKWVDNPAWLKIKWPNDIYFGDRKVAGILIENIVGDGAIERSIVGIGLNVNQKEFERDIPNPISLWHVTGLEADRDKLLETVVDSILDMVDSYESDPEADELTDIYNSLLWRNDDGFHLWQLPDGTDFEGRLVNVDTTGRLHLVTPGGEQRSFLFKEVMAVI